MRDNILPVLAIVATAAVIGWAVFSSNDVATLEGIVPGIGGGPGESPLATQSATQASDLRVLIPEHGILASDHLQRLYDGENTSETSQRLEDNNQKIASVIESMGGNKEDFLNHWRAHITSYENYTNALKNNDRNGTSQARNELSNHATEFGRVINQTIPNISADEARRLMEEHIDLTLSIVEAHARQDTSEQLRQITAATNQAINFANTLMSGIQQN